MKKAASIFLRADIVSRDIDKLIDWLQNRRITRFLNEDHMAADELRELRDTIPAPMFRYRFNQNGIFYLICDDEDDSIGFVKLREEASGCYEIVFAIGEETLWGNGYGSSAIRAAQAQAFLYHRGRKLTARIYHGNDRSIGAVRRCGFREEHRFEQLSCYSITDEEYFSIHAKKRA